MTQADRWTAAAEYIRMSTDRQDVSLAYQSRMIRSWAVENGYEVVATFADEGISGVGIEKRQGLKDLLRTVIGGQAAFRAILVYDVSRWGRFQNPDQAAHYEFMCQEAGVKVEYCAEPFRNDGSALSGLIKHVKRTMAAEFSREASERTSKAKMVLRQRSYWTGGKPGFGFQRAIVDTSGNVVRICGPGDKFSRLHCHTRLVHGPEKDVAIVRQIYQRFLQPGETFTGIAQALNTELKPTSVGERWTLNRVRSILSNPKYCGRHTAGRTRRRLGGPAELVDERFWVVGHETCQAIVTTDIFTRVAEKISRRNRRATDEELIADLRRVLETQGHLNEKLIVRYGHFGLEMVRDRFGGMQNAYAACGYVPDAKQTAYIDRIKAAPKVHSGPRFSSTELLDMLRTVWKTHGQITVDLINNTPGLPHSTTFCRRFGTISDAYTAIGYRPNAQQLRMAQKVRRSKGQSRSRGLAVQLAPHD